VTIDEDILEQLKETNRLLLDQNKNMLALRDHMGAYPYDTRFVNAVDADNPQTVGAGNTFDVYRSPPEEDFGSLLSIVISATLRSYQLRAVFNKGGDDIRLRFDSLADMQLIAQPHFPSAWVVNDTALVRTMAFAAGSGEGFVYHGGFRLEFRNLEAVDIIINGAFIFYKVFARTVEGIPFSQFTQKGRTLHTDFS